MSLLCSEPFMAPTSLRAKTQVRLVAHKALPHHLPALTSSHCPPRSLWSRFLAIPQTCHAWSSLRAFALSVPSSWNALSQITMGIASSLPLIPSKSVRPSQAIWSKIANNPVLRCRFYYHSGMVRPTDQERTAIEKTQFPAGGKAHCALKSHTEKHQDWSGGRGSEGKHGGFIVVSAERNRWGTVTRLRCD